MWDAIVPMSFSRRSLSLLSGGGRGSFGRASVPSGKRIRRGIRARWPSINTFVPGTSAAWWHVHGGRVGSLSCRRAALSKMRRTVWGLLRVIRIAWFTACFAQT